MSLHYALYWFGSTFNLGLKFLAHSLGHIYNIMTNAIDLLISPSVEIIVFISKLTDMPPF